jgi:hypothetical protein
LLADWLAEDVPLALILAAVEVVAQRRSKRQARTRLTLGRCRREVEKRRRRMSDGGALGANVQQSDGALASLSRPAQKADAWRIKLTRFGDSLPATTPAAKQLAKRLRTIAKDEGLTLQRAAESSIAAIREFHELNWHNDKSGREAALAHAQTTLGAMTTILPPSAVADLVQETARAAMRARWPEVSAVRLWDTLGGPDAAGTQ